MGLKMAPRLGAGGPEGPYSEPLNSSPMALNRPVTMLTASLIPAVLLVLSTMQMLSRTRPPKRHSISPTRVSTGISITRYFSLRKAHGHRLVGARAKTAFSCAQRRGDRASRPKGGAGTTRMRSGWPLVNTSPDLAARPRGQEVNRQTDPSFRRARAWTDDTPWLATSHRRPGINGRILPVRDG